MRRLFSLFFRLLGWAYWVEIVTDVPRCTYYFGPFDSRREAQDSSPGYIEDLKDEGAIGIQIKIQQRQTPAELTVFQEDDLGGATGRRSLPTLSGQMS
ncbi:MAG: DUF1816 domain-containing protein [Spirulinaceae cyanobacterium RM2_2_10]|nr:DUF1816 domain-containing protein [Spirulinaceae cyanobacterium SM2_1_0]NJO19624.1 DUF1816 domain-containing protein [Spirulinaceae cyanobacterium RM2_2_10]